MPKKLARRFKRHMRQNHTKLFYRLRWLYWLMSNRLDLMAMQIAMRPIFRSKTRFRDNVERLSTIDLRHGDIAIDCGANLGDFTEIMASKDATVWAFEPNPWCYKILKQRFSGRSNIHVLNKAVLDRKDRLRLYLHRDSYEDPIEWSCFSSLLSSHRDVDRKTFVEVEAIDLVEFIDRLNSFIKVVKMDIEGAECPVVDKLIDSNLIKKIGVLLVETHDESIPSLKQKTEKLRMRVAREDLSNIDLSWG